MRKFLLLAILFVLVLCGFAQNEGSLYVKQDDRVEKLMKRQREVYAVSNTMNGFRVQIFMEIGNEAVDHAEVVKKEFEEAHPELPIAHLEGTYLAWVDVRSIVDQPPYNGSSDRLAAELRQQRKVWINGGEMYGQAGFMRVNLATQRSRLAEALRRLLSA